MNEADIIWDDPLETALQMEGITGQKADIARSIYQQESGQGRNTKTSNAGARGGMQIIPATFRRVADKDWSIDDPVQNARAGVRYIAKLHELAGGDPSLTAAGYYGGEGAIIKARNGQAVSDPRNPNAPNTLEYGQQVASRLPKINDADIIWDDQTQKIDQNPTPLAPTQPSKNFGERLDADLRAIPRQTGLAARYAIEGVSGIPDIVAQPLISGVNAFLPADKQQMNFGQMGSAFADKIGLPQPENSTERIVGDAARMLAGGGALVKGAGMAKEALTGGAKAIAAGLSYRPELQAASAVGSGLAGGYTRETGGGPTAQAVASVAGGLMAPGVVAGGMGLANAARGMRVDPQQVTLTIRSALNDNGIRPQDIPMQVMSSLEDDVAKAMSTGDVSGDALKRLIDYRLVGATPGRGNLTLTPGDVTQQKNLAKTGINSSNPKLQALANQQNENTGVFINKLNELGADGATDAYTAGNRLIGAVKKPIAKAKGEIGAAYDAVRNDAGVSANIDNYAFTQRAGDLLAKNLSEGFLPADIRGHLNKIATGQTPLTVSTAEQLKTVIGRQQRSTTDGNTRYALGLVRQALDEAPVMSSEGQSAIDAANNARGLNREWMQKVEKTPALKAVMDEASPDDFIKKQVINADVQDLARLKNTVKGNPEAIGTIKAQIVQHLKKAAVGVNPDEARVFTQSGLNKAIEAIGEQKLKMFLSPEELSQLKALGRVARYEQVQPVGSAVNNSNTAGAVINYFDDLLKKIPFGKQAISDPMEYIMHSSQAKRVSNVPNALTMQRQRQNNLLLPSPMLLIPGQFGDY